MNTVKFKKHIYPPSQEFGDLTPALSCEGDITIFMSIKDVGKSYPAMRLLKKCNLNGGNGVWLRWDISELATARDEFLRDENYHVEKMGGQKHGYVVRNKKSGYVIYLIGVKYAQTYKGIDLPNLKWICYDEFIPEYYDTQTRKLVEFDRFMILLSALWRTNHPRVIMICNTIDWFNSYFKAWGIVPFGAGLIRISTFDMSVMQKTEIGDITINRTFKIVCENMRPSAKMIERIMGSEGLRGDNNKMQRYIENYYKNQYTLIEKCPDMKLQLEPMQVFYNDKYYGYRVYKNVIYWCETGKRNVPTDVSKRCDMQLETRPAIRPIYAKTIEDGINAGYMRFDSGYTYNAIIGYIYEVRNHAS